MLHRWCLKRPNRVIRIIFRYFQTAGYFEATQTSFVNQMVAKGGKLCKATGGL